MTERFYLSLAFPWINDKYWDSFHKKKPVRNTILYHDKRHVLLTKASCFTHVSIFFILEENNQNKNVVLTFQMNIFPQLKLEY